MTRICTAPDPFPTDDGSPVVFLAGSIDQGTAGDWQRELIARLDGRQLTVLNPRRSDWDPSWSDDDPALAAQISWEQDGLQRADLVVVVFDPAGKAPVSLLELGQCLARGVPTLVCCPPGYWRRANVVQTTERFGGTLCADLDELAERIAAWQAGDRMLHRGRFLSLLSRGGWEFARRSNASDVVAIAACTEADEMVLIEQVRTPLGVAGEAVIELPAGLVGDDGNHDVAEAARRELIEECGYDAERVSIVGRGPSSAGLCDEIITLCTASGLHKVGAGGGIGDENITTHLVPMAEVDAWLAERAAAGHLIDAKVYAGLHLLRVQT